MSMSMLPAEDVDFEGLRHLQHKTASNGMIVCDNVLLCKSFAGSKSLEPQFANREAATAMQQSHHQEQSSTSILNTCQMVQLQSVVNASNIDLEALSVTDKKLERRQKLRDKKRVQRQNQDFAARERLRARGRIKALREDPVFREGERQRDRERRRKARLFNQTQRMQERDRDKHRKSMMRSLESKSVKRESSYSNHPVTVNGIG